MNHPNQSVKPPIKDILITLQEHDTFEVLSEGWDSSLASCPATQLPFLSSESILENLLFCGLDASHLSELHATAQTIDKSTPLRLLAWHLHQSLYHATEKNLFEQKAWPALRHSLAEPSGHFYLLVALALVPQVKLQHKTLGVSLKVSRDTCKAVQGFCLNYMKGHEGRLGIFIKQIYWLQRHARGELFRLGRLEYYLTHFDKTYSGGCEVYRHRHTGRVQVLAHAGAAFDKDGRAYASANAPEVTWTAQFEAGDDHITGNAIDPDGTAHPTQVTLSTCNWKQELNPTDWVLSMHIPSGGRLTPDLFKDSMQRAFTFFDQHFHEQPVNAVICESWIFGDMLEAILPSTTNLVCNIYETYQWATNHTNSYDNLWFIFCQADGDFCPQSAIANSRLEKTALAHVRSGGAWRNGSIFFLRDDLPTFGTQHYRKTDAPVTL